MEQASPAAAWAAAAHFIYDVRELEQVSLPGVALAASFDIASYSDDLYGALEVELPEQLQKAVNKRKAEFLCGRFLASLALERLGRQRQTIGMGQHRQPLWPADVSGSISHSSDRAACVMSADAGLGLGIDIENIQTDSAARKLASIVVEDAERTLLEVAQGGFGLGFTAVFSAKEALFKALYPRVQRYFDFHAARLTRLDWSTGVVILELTRDLERGCRVGDCFQVGIRRDETRVWTHLIVPPNPVS